MKSSIEDDFREVSTYLDEVLAMEMDARQDWLDDLETRAPAVAVRLRSYLKEMARLDREHFMELPATLPPAVPTLRGQRFGHYTLLRPLGHGGMGTVWLANRNEGPFKGEAAVKLLNASLIGHPAEQRFLREGNVLAKLRHPNIAHLLDAGIGAGGQPYLILEYVRGDRLDLYCDKHNLDIEQRIALFLSVLAAVAHAHSNLIVHRDLKPENILVSEDGTVKLLDFGVAALLSSAADESAPLTRLVPAGLTPGYAAPEQFLQEPVTTATDVYALGLVLFALLAGRHPLLSGDRTAAELMRLTLEKELPRPSQIAAERRKQRLLSGDLDNIVSMAVRRNPVERYVSVDAFASDLRRYLALEPVLARPPSFGYRAAKFVRRHRGAVAAALVITLILIGAMDLTISKMLEARHQRDQARFQTRRADAFSGFLTAMMQSDSGPNRARMSYFERADFGVQMINKQYLAEDPQFAGRMLIQLAAMFRDSGELARAAPVYEQAYEIGRRNHNPEIMASAQCNRAYGEASAGVREGTLERIKEGKTLLERVGSDDSVLRAECAKAEGRLELDYGHYDQAAAILSEAIKQIEAAGETHTQIYAETVGGLAEVYVTSHRLREALPMVERVGEIHDRNGRGGTADRLIVRQNAAFVLAQMGEIRAALREREIIQEHLHDVETPGQEPFAYALNYATLLLRMDRPADGMGALAGTLERTRQQGNRLAQARTLFLEGSILARLGRLDEAEVAAREASVIATDGLGNKDYQAQVQSLMARLDLARGDFRSAQRHSVDALALAGYQTKNPERSLASTLLVAAQVDLANRSFADAERSARDSLAISESVARGPDTSADVGEALLRLAQARIASGSATGAGALLERALRCLSNGLDPAHPLAIEARKLLQSLPEPPTTSGHP